MTTNEVAKLENCERQTVSRWCQRQGNIKRVMNVNGVMEWDLTKKDLENFRQREKPGGYRRK